MNPTQEWLEQYRRIREKTRSPVDLNTYFEQPQIAGRQLAVLDIGPCSLPSGRLLVRDPLVTLGLRREQPYLLAAPAGDYPTELCVVCPDERDCARYAAVRLRFSRQPAVAFYEALTGQEDLSEAGEERYFGFAVDAGLGCICDAAVHPLFCDWCDSWDREHPGGNLYRDYFAALFAESYRLHPEYQRQEGDWLNWQLPGTAYHLPLFQSGFGDGVYPVYWGFDAAGQVCQLVVQFIDIQLAYGEEQEE